MRLYGGALACRSLAAIWRLKSCIIASAASRRRWSSSGVRSGASPDRLPPAVGDDGRLRCTLRRSFPRHVVVLGGRPFGGHLIRLLNRRGALMGLRRIGRLDHSRHFQRHRLLTPPRPFIAIGIGDDTGHGRSWGRGLRPNSLARPHWRGHARRPCPPLPAPLWLLRPADRHPPHRRGRPPPPWLALLYQSVLAQLRGPPGVK